VTIIELIRINFLKSSRNSHQYVKIFTGNKNMIIYFWHSNLKLQVKRLII